MRIRWLPEAIEDLDRIDAFYSKIDPELAKRAATVILDLAESLDQFSERGRPSRVAGTRELVGTFGAGALILRYQAFDGGILVVQVKHSRQNKN